MGICSILVEIPKRGLAKKRLSCVENILISTFFQFYPHRTNRVRLIPQNCIQEIHAHQYRSDSIPRHHNFVTVLSYDCKNGFILV